METNELKPDQARLDWSVDHAMRKVRANPRWHHPRGLYRRNRQRRRFP